MAQKKKKAADTSYEDNDLKNLINKDLDRTHQEIDLFLQNKIRNILANVLYIWSKENSDVSYRQGMNELLAILYLVFYPYYFPPTRKPKSTRDDIIEFLKDIELYKEDIYIFFHDEDEIQSDLFFTFEALMKKGMTNLFNPLVLQKDDPGYKLYEIFPQMWKDDSDQDKPTYVYRRCSLLVKEKLKSLDNDLYSHFKRIDLNCGVFLQRWLRCIFCREFKLDDVYLIWDFVFHNDYVNENTQKYSFIFMEYICIAMIFKIRDTLKDADQNECLSTLFKYPEVSDIMELIKLSQKVETAINERLNGKNSNVYDILGIMKPIESEPTHIFSPHMFNQTSSKGTQNSNNNNNSSSNTSKFNTNSEQTNNISTNENNNKFEQFDEDEKDNINLDSVDHNNYSNNNNNNDIGSQAKSFFNNALSSLSNFGGIIKDQIQNAKDTVIDSFTGNETSNNNYENNYQQNDYYYNNDSNNNNEYNNNSNYNDTYNNRNSYNNENNINNNVNNRKNSVEQNEQNTNEIRKESFDSSNDLTYNRQDMTDIINKLKEFDTRYNMFFNDEDKRNFRIIIDYLKAKM